VNPGKLCVLILLSLALTPFVVRAQLLRPESIGPSAPPGAPTAVSLEAKGEQQILQGRWLEAIETLQQAMKLDPARLGPRFGLATCYIRLERYEDALLLLSPVYEQLPENPFVLNNLAWIHLHAHDPKVRNLDMALKYARHALVNSPNDPNIWGTMAEIYLASGKAKEALRMAEIGLATAQAQDLGEVLEFEELINRCHKELGIESEPNKSRGEDGGN
jgi:predicted Zn-dependent protease